MKELKHIKVISDSVFLIFACALLFMNLPIWKWVESLSLFLPGTQFFQRFLHIPGGILAYLGCFLTQSLHYPVLGSLLFVALLFVVQRLTEAVFSFSKEAYPLSFIPSFMLLTAVVNMGYTWLTIKAVGHFFTPTLGCCFFLLSAWAYLHIKYPLVRLVIILALAFSYIWFGFYALCAVGLCALLEGKRNVDLKRYVLFLLIGVVAIWLTPKLCYYSFDTTEQEISRMYLGGMPDFFVRKSELMLWMPFLILIGCLIIFAACSIFTVVHLPNKLKGIPMAFYLCALLFTASQVYRNENFTASVRANLAMDTGDWQEAYHVARNVKGNPSRDVIINGELAQVMLGMPKANQELPDIPASYKDSRPGFSTFMQLAGLPMLYYMGQTNLCYRWGMEMSVEYGWRPSSLKYMVRCALLKGEYALANKYNGILMKTMNHKDWAKKYQPFIDNPDLMKQEKEFIQIASAAKDLPDMFVE